MIATLRMEVVGDDMDRLLATRPPGRTMMIVIEAIRVSYWVAEIGIDPDGAIKRQFVRGKKDFSRADVRGRHGVYAYYTLHSGRLYEIQERVTWRRAKRYYARVTVAGQIEVVPPAAIEELRRRKAQAGAR